MEEITLVTDFFDIGRGQDKNKDLRRTAQRYFDEFKRWARIQNTLVVYTDSDSAEIIKGIRAEYGLEDKTIIVQTDNLFELVPGLLPKLEKISHNKDFLNFRYLPEASSNNPKYDYLWMMKYYFMNDAYERGLVRKTKDSKIDNGWTLDSIMEELLTVMQRIIIFCGNMILTIRYTFPVCMILIQ